MKQINVNHYEQVALSFFYQKNYRVAIHFFLKAIERTPQKAMLWYGLGDSIAARVVQQHVPEMYNLTISCLKKCLAIAPKNNYANALLDRMSKHPEIGSGHVDEIKQMENVYFNSLQKLKVDENVLIHAFRDIQDSDTRVRITMLLGETNDEDFYPLLRHALLHDDSMHVKFAALKRISHFRNHPDLRTTLEYVFINSNPMELEPYFSLALGKIQKGWSKKMLEQFT